MWSLFHFFFFETRSLIELGLAVLVRLSYLPSSASQVCTTIYSFSVHTGDLNSGPFAYAVVTLPMGPFQQSWDPPPPFFF